MQGPKPLQPRTRPRARATVRPNPDRARLSRRPSCLVARTQSKLEAVAAECNQLAQAAALSSAGQSGKVDRSVNAALTAGPAKVLSLAVDFTDVESMLGVRQAVEDAWGGLDSVHIVAGVLSTRTFAALTGSPPTPLSTNPADAAGRLNDRARAGFAPAEKAGIESVLDLARCVEGLCYARERSLSRMLLIALPSLARPAHRRSIATNYLGPLLSYATFLPLLSAHSVQPTVILLSTVAAVLPTPTRTLYSASKGASHALLASLALESDLLGLGVEFIEILAGSVNTSLRTRAVDASTAKGVNAEPPSKYSLEPAAVAASVIEAVDCAPASAGISEEPLRLRQIWLPARPYRWAHLLYWLPGDFGRRKVEDGARDKYRAALMAQ